MTRVNRRSAALAMLASVLWPNITQAQTNYPNKPIRVIVTFPPGGSSDAMIRLLSPKVSEALGQPIIIDNKPGAGGNIGLAQVAKSPADGYTLGVGAAGALTANANLYSDMPYETFRDFQAITMLAAIPFVIVGAPSLKIKNLKDLITHAKREPNTLSIAHGGNGTAMHLTTALFEQMAEIKLVNVPYRGSGPAALAVLSSQVPLGVVDLAASLPNIKAGKLIAFAVTSPQRLSMLPEVPSVSEAALPGYDSTGWFGLVAPAGTPNEIIVKLNTAFNSALNEENIQKTMRGMGMEPTPSSAAAFDEYMHSETKKWGQVIREANIKLD